MCLWSKVFFEDLLLETVADAKEDDTLSIVVVSIVKGLQPLSLVLGEWSQCRDIPFRRGLPARKLIESRQKVLRFCKK
jgi:hypothetical protein